MKSHCLKISVFLILIVTAFHCSSLKNKPQQTQKDISVTDTIAIVNKDADYKIIIIDPGFNTWLLSNAKQRGYYSQGYLEIKNNLFVTNWNIKASNPSASYRDLYTMQINYDSTINYGYEVNYLLYNYFVYFQQKYRQNLSNG
ncbi:hypothetical protein FHR24_000630 [Wenyingzhuangia heitensis]|uniref:Lipoprotein n=1 Tax=Wenyingzhuangia heitensis TaxID=1487859 RepID=A0ABX0UAL0_9FLAO|nr:DUF6146 family protein [Wenyingzhuangia heitensis]NIJ44191.1 hypothetical protein [Wenyingzhuangia heitensis]